MKLKAVSVKVFELFEPDGKSLGLFTVQDTWNGLYQLATLGDREQSLIVDFASFGSIFADIFQRAEVEVVRASPKMLERMKL